MLPVVYTGRFHLEIQFEELSSSPSHFHSVISLDNIYASLETSARFSSSRKRRVALYRARVFDMRYRYVYEVYEATER